MNLPVRSLVPEKPFHLEQIAPGVSLRRLYPGGKADYMKAFDASLNRAVKDGFMLPADRAEIRDLAAAGWPGA